MVVEIKLCAVLNTGLVCCVGTARDPKLLDYLTKICGPVHCRCYDVHINISYINLVKEFKLNPIVTLLVIKLLFSFSPPSILYIMCYSLFLSPFSLCFLSLIF